MRMERELEYVRSDRDRNELYLQRILREVDQKVSTAFSIVCIPIRGSFVLVSVFPVFLVRSLVWLFVCLLSRCWAIFLLFVNPDFCCVVRVSCCRVDLIA